MPEVNEQAAAVQGTLRERPLPRLLQQLYRKKFTGHIVITDQTRDQSEVYLRDGWPVHVCRPVDTDRLDNLLVEYGLVPAEIVAQASAQVAEGMRLGDVLERMGALDREKLAQALKAQVTRKLTRLFFVAEGTYAVYLSAHGFGEGGDLALMRVDPRSVVYPGIRAAYNLPRVTRELARLADHRFRLAAVSSGFVAALGISQEDAIVDSLRKGWMTLDDLDSMTSRPFELRSVVLALYYCDALDREAMVQPPADTASPPATSSTRQSGVYRVSRLSSESGIVFNIDSPGSSEISRLSDGPGSGPVPAAAPASPAAAISPPAPAAAPAPAPVLPPAAASAAPVRPQPAPAASRPSGSIPVAKGAGVVSPPNPSVAANESVAGGSVPAAPARPGTPIVRSAFMAAARPMVKAAPATPPRFPTGAGSAPGPDVVRANIQEMAQKLDKSTHFEILGVGQNASADEVGTAFVRAARQFHPDRLTSAGLADLQPLAERILSRINEAAMVLGNAGRRAEYVASLAPGAQAQQNLPSLLEAENMFLKGEVYLKKGDHGKAIESFSAAIQGNSSEPQYQAYLAWTRFDDPRARKEVIVRDTLRILEGVLKERPKFSRGYYWVGQLWKFLNETNKAEHAFREAVQIDNSFIEASRELRLIEMRKSKAPAPKAGGKADPKGGFWKK